MNLKLVKENLKIAMIGIFTFLSGAASILSYLGYGFNGSLQIVIILLSLIIFCTLIVLMVINMWKLNIRYKSLLTELEENKSVKISLEKTTNALSNIGNITEVKEIYIIASGTETYYGIISDLLINGKLNVGIRINICFRVGTDTNRHAKLIEYEKKWESLRKQFSLVIDFYPLNDFIFNFRGIVFDNNLGLIGFYHRINGNTVGSEKPILLVQNQDSIGEYLISNFVNVFQCLKHYKKISLCIRK